MSFKDRSDAGRKLAAAVMEYKDQQPVVLALNSWILPSKGTTSARGQAAAVTVGQTGGSLLGQDSASRPAQ